MKWWAIKFLKCKKKIKVQEFKKILVKKIAFLSEEDDSFC